MKPTKLQRLIKRARLWLAEKDVDLFIVLLVYMVFVVLTR
jgi:hypothetical protein